MDFIISNSALRPPGLSAYGSEPSVPAAYFIDDFLQCRQIKSEIDWLLAPNGLPELAETLAFSGSLVATARSKAQPMKLWPSVHSRLGMARQGLNENFINPRKIMRCHTLREVARKPAGSFEGLASRPGDLEQGKTARSGHSEPRSEPFLS